MRFLMLALSFGVLAGLAGCSDSDDRPPAIALRADTAIARRATLSMLRRAWAERPHETSNDHLWYERRLLDRAGFFGRKVRDTEIYREACTFWMSCVREHVERYDDERYKGL